MSFRKNARFAGDGTEDLKPFLALPLATPALPPLPLRREATSRFESLQDFRPRNERSERLSLASEDYGQTRDPRILSSHTGMTGIAGDTLPCESELSALTGSYPLSPSRATFAALIPC
jgi:hypothetical protein